jgi:hypothetical protein
MLSPHDRTALFDALRPPPGYGLDQAIGTSFTLDLEALLTAPIAFALFAARDTEPDGDGIEPVGLLEAIRRHSARITMFCQSGQIGVPAKHRAVFAWLESAVHEVSPPHRHRIFHPKVWVARYAERAGRRHVLRVLCGTRNLTFDTSWDTLLRLESDPYDTAPVTSEPSQAELADLIRALPGLAVRRVPGDQRAAVDALATDVAAVPLAVPEPFDTMHFHVLGLDRRGGDPLPPRVDRALIVSPFLGEAWLRRLAHRAGSAVLVSREESLDRLTPDLLEAFERLAVLNPAADVAPDRATDTTMAGAGTSTPTDAGDPARLFGGLHAKLFVFDTPNGAVVLTGSANATDAAFDGNVEVLTQLRGAGGPGGAGVDSVLGETPGEVGFADLLVDYTPLDQPVDASEDERLELDVDALRRQLAAVDFRATVRSAGDGYLLTLASDRPLPRLDDGEATLVARPMTLADSQASTALVLGAPAQAAFEVTLEGLTAFFALHLSARRGTAAATTTFLVAAELVGAPADRESRLLAAMLRDPDRLLRYLVLLLSEVDPVLGDGAGDGAARWVRRWHGAGWEGIPLLELLVRAADRFPDRLEHIENLLRDLGAHGETVLPAGFDDLWDPIRRYLQDEEAVR